MDWILPVALIIIFGCGSYMLNRRIVFRWSPLKVLNFRSLGAAALLALFLLSPETHVWSLPALLLYIVLLGALVRALFEFQAASRMDAA